MSDPAKPPIYPRYCFHLAPTVNTWCLFRVADVHGLDQHEGFEGELPERVVTEMVTDS